MTENIEIAINKAALTAIKKFNEEQRKEQRDKRLHNTRLLMKHYNALKEHIDSVNTNEKLINYLEEEGINDRAFISSIAKTKFRTAKMLGYIDSALEIVKEKFKKNCEEYKYKAFELYYIDKKTNEEIQEKLSCSKNSPKRWSDAIIEELSLLLWGIEALGI